MKTRNQKSPKRYFEKEAIEQHSSLMIELIKNASAKGWKQPWLPATVNGMPKNIESKKQYRGINLLLLLMEMTHENWNAPWFFTPCQLNALKKAPLPKYLEKPIDENGNPISLHPLKGSKAFPIWCPCITYLNPSTDEKITEKEYNELPSSQQKTYIKLARYRISKVFNICQTNLKEARPDIYEKLMDKPDFSSENTEKRIPVLDYVIQESRWVCPINTNESDDAYYSVAKDQIFLPLPEQFKSAECFASTAFHEMAHSTGAKNRLDRFKEGTTFASEEYATEELIAEMAASLTCAMLGITANVKDESADYMRGWVERKNEFDNCRPIEEAIPELIGKILQGAVKASEMIVECIESATEALKEKENMFAA